MKLSNLLVVLSALALSACQTNPSKPYVADTSRSYAKNVMLAGGIGGDLRDVSWQDAKKAREKALAEGAVDSGGPSLAGAGAFGVVNYLSPPPGFSMAGAGVMGALSWMAVGSTDPSSAPHVIAWMPKSGATSPKSAQTEFAALIAAAMEKAVKNVQLPDGYAFGDVTRTDTGPFGGKGEWTETTVAISGSRCSEPLRQCSFNITLKDPYEGFAPMGNGGYPAYAFVARGTAHDDHTGWIRQSAPVMSSDKASAYVRSWSAILPEAEFYVALSRYLPDWVYIYLPGGQRVARHTPDGAYSWLPYPVLLNKGSTHYFIEPEPATATAAAK
jgi:hypothetical protein